MHYFSLFENLIFENPDKFCKIHYFDTTVTLFVLPKKPKNTIKLRENKPKKSWTRFLTYNLDQFLTYRNPKSWTSF